MRELQIERDTGGKRQEEQSKQERQIETSQLSSNNESSCEISVLGLAMFFPLNFSLRFGTLFTWRKVERVD